MHIRQILQRSCLATLLLATAPSFAASSPFRYIVALDGSGDYTTVQAAIDACPNNERSIIFIKNGTYEENVSIGTRSIPSTQKITLLGESQEGVKLLSNVYMKNNGGTGADIYATAALHICAEDFYAENITFANEAHIVKESGAGQALATNHERDRHTFKNCSFKGYQDTHRSKKSTRSYYKNCFIEGRTDFVYAGGTCIFDTCQINSIGNGGYISAPEDIPTTVPKSLTAGGKTIYLGFIFRKCKLTALSGGTGHHLGRPWQSTSGSIFLNCELGPHIADTGWAPMGSSNTSTIFFGEYKSVDNNGEPIDISKRIDWSVQVHEDDVKNFLTPAYIYNKVNPSVKYDPFPIVAFPETPNQVKLTETTLSWEPVDGCAGYVIRYEGAYIGATTESSFTLSEAKTEDKYTVWVVPTGEASQIISSIETVETPDSPILSLQGNQIMASKPVTLEIHNLQGALVQQFTTAASSFVANPNLNGLFIATTYDASGTRQTQKILFSNY